jgi:hypothetical protein
VETNQAQSAAVDAWEIEGEVDMAQGFAVKMSGIEFFVDN